jgi:dienelactone hydrolase
MISLSGRKKMKRLILNLLVLVALATTISSNVIKNVPVRNNSEDDGFVLKQSGAIFEPAENKLFSLEREHPAFRLDGCSVECISDDRLSFEVKRSGHSMVVLQASAPLKIAEQTGVIGKLSPGWDGTLGYSLYALEVETGVIGRGEIRLAVVPVPSGADQSPIDFNSRNSRFPGTRTAFETWQKEWRKKLMKRLMNGEIPKRVPISAEVISNENRRSFKLRRVSYRSQPDRKNELLMALPLNISGAVPLLIALHGHEATWGKADTAAFTQGHADDFCAYFASRGWAVLQPATMDHTLQHNGWTLQGEWTWDAMVALDYATALPEVDAQRVVVCGLSTGGHLAMNLLALDERVNAGVVGCVLSTWNHYIMRMRIPPHCDCGILSQLGNWLEQCDWAALAVPKPVQFQHGRSDAGFCPGADPALLNQSWNTSVMPEEEFDSMFAEVRRAYRQVDAEEHVELFIHKGGHQVNNEAAYKFLESALNK